MKEATDTNEGQCPCCLGEGNVISAEGDVNCPICEGYGTVPKEIAQRFMEVWAKRLPGGEVG